MQHQRGWMSNRRAHTQSVSRSHNRMTAKAEHGSGILAMKRNKVAGKAIEERKEEKKVHGKQMTKRLPFCFTFSPPFVFVSLSFSPALVLVHDDSCVKHLLLLAIRSSFPVAFLLLSFCCRYYLSVTIMTMLITICLLPSPVPSPRLLNPV